MLSTDRSNKRWAWILLCIQFQENYATFFQSLCVSYASFRWCTKIVDPFSTASRNMQLCCTLCNIALRKGR